MTPGDAVLELTDADNQVLVQQAIGGGGVYNLRIPGDKPLSGPLWGKLRAGGEVVDMVCFD